MLGHLLGHVWDVVTSIPDHIPDLPDLPDPPSLDDLADSSDYSDHISNSVQPHFGSDPDPSATYTSTTDSSSVSGADLKSDNSGSWYNGQYDYNHSQNAINPNDLKKTPNGVKSLTECFLVKCVPLQSLQQV